MGIRNLLRRIPVWFHLDQTRVGIAICVVFDVACLVACVIQHQIAVATFLGFVLAIDVTLLVLAIHSAKRHERVPVDVGPVSYREPPARRSPRSLPRRALLAIGSLFVWLHAIAIAIMLVMLAAFVVLLLLGQFFVLLFSHLGSATEGVHP